MSIKKYYYSHSGFTLIELLVVISIIGVLSSFAVVQLNDARTKSRDALRKADTAQLRTALNLYYDDNTEYPVCGSISDADHEYGTTAVCYTGVLATALTTGDKQYMEKIPTDPKNTGEYIYAYVSDGSEYYIYYMLEGEDDAKYIRGW